jgi:hypothetical protein
MVQPAGAQRADMVHNIAGASFMRSPGRRTGMRVPEGGARRWIAARLKKASFNCGIRKIEKKNPAHKPVLVASASGPSL